MPSASASTFAALPVFLTGLGYALFWTNDYTDDLLCRCIFSLAFLLAYLYNAAFFVIDAMTGNGADESFFYHLEQGVEGAGLGQHRHVIRAAAVAVSVGLMLAWAALRRSPPQRRRRTKSLSYSLSNNNNNNNGHHHHHRKRQSFARRAMPLVAVIVSFAVHPLSFALSRQYSSSIPFANNHNDGGGSAEDWEPSDAFREIYRDPRKIDDFEPEKNIVHIYMEGVERNYLDDDRFEGVAPRLRMWEERGVSFTNVSQAQNTGWTVAGLVSSLCGIPLLTTGGGGNSMAGMGDFLPGATCLTDLLKKAGYSQTWVGGSDLAFAGKGTFLQTHGFDRLLGREDVIKRHRAIAPRNEKEAHLVAWGVQDDQMLDVVFDEYEKLSAAEEPFALYGLTLDTHGSDPSPRCVEAGVVTGDGTITDSVRCTDYLVDKFLHRILDEDAKRGNNTLVIVSSDHLAMGYVDGWEGLKSVGPRRNTLFALGNDLAPETHAAVGTMMDVPATIMSLLGHPGKEVAFGRDLTTGESLLSRDPDLDENTLSKIGKDIKRQFWRMPGIRNTAVIYTKKELLFLGGKQYPIPVLLGANSNGTIREINLWAYGDKVPVALRKHSENITVVVDDCKYYRPELAGRKSKFCLFVDNGGSEHGGWIRLLKRRTVTVDLRAALNMTSPRAGFVRAEGLAELPLDDRTRKK